MAKERGIETYLLNWNIFVSPEFSRAHNVAPWSVTLSHIGGQDDFTGELVERYTKEVITQLLDEYPDLTGLGITLGERMGGMTCKRRSKSAAGGGPIVRHLAQLTAVTLRGQAATEECGRLGQWRSFPAGTSGPTKRSAAPSIFVGGPAAATDFEPPVRVAAGRDA
jgi:hypothetical protein